MVLPANGQDAVQGHLAQEGVLVLEVLVVPHEAGEDQREQLRVRLHCGVQLPAERVHVRIAEPLRHCQLRADRLRVLQAPPRHAVDHVPDRHGVTVGGAPLREGLLDDGAGRRQAAVDEGVQRDLQPLVGEPPEVEGAADDGAGVAVRLLLATGPQLREDLLVSVQDLRQVRGRLRALLQGGDHEELHDAIQSPSGLRSLAKLVLLGRFLHRTRGLSLRPGLGAHARLALLLCLLRVVALPPLRLWVIALALWTGLLSAALADLPCCVCICLRVLGRSLGHRLGRLLLRLLLRRRELLQPPAVLQHLLLVCILDANEAQHPGELWLGLHRQRVRRKRLWRHVHVNRLRQPMQQVLVEGEPLKSLEGAPQEAVRLHRGGVTCERAPVGRVGVVHEVVGKDLRQHLQALLVQVGSLAEDDAVGLLDELYHRALLLRQGLQKPRVEERLLQGARQPHQL
mmetsp:Transcript_17012/g.46086  ORF Transcript_17012/g.46086 Transcript_17012/m.46086 type:complete len:456 (-) Transcript_17012:341-1708(-)